MAESRISPHVLINAVIAAVLVLLWPSLPFGWLTTIGGLTLLLILFAYDAHPQRSAGQSLAFSAVCGLCFILAAAMLLLRLADRKDLDLWLAAAWAGATVLCFFVDRSRSSEPASAPYNGYTPLAPVTAAASGLGIGFNHAPAAAPPSRVYQEQPAPSIIPQEQTSEQPVSVAVEEQVSSAPVVFAAPPPPAPLPLQPPPVIGQGRQAEEAIIYVNVIGQGISLMRSVRAEHITRDVYRIIDVMPEGEIWRYQPGQMVRCRKQKLSNGKCLVAFEEIVPQQVR